MIKAGYALEVTSWENDANYYNTKRMDGLNAVNVKWLVYFLDELVKQKQSGGWELTEAIAEDIYTSVVAKVGGNYAGAAVPLDEVYDFISDLIYSLLGPSCEYTNNVRTVDNYSVYFYGSDVRDMATDFLA